MPKNSTKADKRNHVSQMIDQTEVILKHLAEQMTEEEPCLYVGGFKDGIRVMKFIGSL